MTRAGIRTFWPRDERTVPRVRVVEIAPVVVLLLATCGTDRSGRSGDALHAGDGQRAARAADLHRGRPAGPLGRMAPRRRAHEHACCPFLLLSACLLAMWLLLNQRFRSARSCSAAARAARRMGADGACSRATARIRNAGAIASSSPVWCWPTSCARTSPSRGSFSGRGTVAVISGFVDIPLRLRDPYGLAMLACIITARRAPWVQFNAATRHADDPRPRS